MRKSRTSNRSLRRTRLCKWAAAVAWLASLSSVYLSAQTAVPRVPTPGQAAAADDGINPDRPGIADGSTVVGRGRLQVETGFQQEFRNNDHSTERTSFFPTLLRAGLTARWEARIESNTFTETGASAPESGSNQASGLAPVSAGVKFHIQDSAGPRQPSLGTILRIFPASGSDGLRTNHATGDLRLAADWDLTPTLSLNPNAGVALYEGERNERFVAGLLALTVNYFNAAKTVNPFVDVGMQAPEGSDAGSSLILDAGIAYLPGRNVQIDADAGAGAHGHTPPRRFFSIGVSLRFRASNRGT